MLDYIPADGQPGFHLANFVVFFVRAWGRNRAQRKQTKQMQGGRPCKLIIVSCLLRVLSREQDLIVLSLGPALREGLIYTLPLGLETCHRTPIHHWKRFSPQ
ncbi:hypothetical protein BVZ28_12200 [Alcaligenes faecalis]|nr:hypothetical protein CPY64_06715 [Alcaligenes faecalis]AYZ92228.1 hypothetical protein EGY22_12480 [Alcaligenes faecalis]KAA1286869.1 hypothetical protein D7S43_08145 [Alcaligenes faecalis]OSZ33533.1 hypothetical protein BVZ28_12200 [Alcaligenes faecalis]OSZ47506.1 hypothetical protein BVZ29_01290 [Alcaligenes faecalis]